MTLVKITEILKKAQKEKYAVGAFNADNLEMVQAFIAASEKMRSPLILQVSLGAINYSGLNSAANIALYEAQTSAMPIAVHLDHVTDMEHNILALRAGVGSLGVDASALSYSENVDLTGRVCVLAHTAGLDAEAGLGYVPDHHESYSEKQINDCKTGVDQALEFTAKTGVDLLAVAVGSMRGMSSRELTLDIPLVKKLSQALQIPLVLHGASGVKWESITAAIAHGICKVNIASTFDQCFLHTICEEASRNPDETNFRKIFAVAKQAVEEEACAIIKRLGSNGKY